MEANDMRQEFNLRYGAAFGSDVTFDDREITSFLNKAQSEFTHSRYAAWKNRPQLGYGSHPVRNAELAGLLTSTNAVARKYHLLGNENNGALPGPDLDNIDQPMEQFGVFVPLPDECLYVVSERVKTVKDGYIKPNGKVMKVTHPEYESDIFNTYRQPGDNLTWSLDWGSYTTATISETGEYTNSAKTKSDAGTGNNMEGINYLYEADPVDANKVYINTGRSIYLIPGKGWKIDEYKVTYVKEPTDIHIDVQTPGLQINCQLPSHTHSEIVDIAVKLGAAAVVPEQNKYEVNRAESIADE